MVTFLSLYRKKKLQTKKEQGKLLPLKQCKNAKEKTGKKEFGLEEEFKQIVSRIGGICRDVTSPVLDPG